MQITKEAKVTKALARGRLYGRVTVYLPGYFVGKKVYVIVWTEPTIEEFKYGQKGVKLSEGSEKKQEKKENEVKPEEKMWAELRETPMVGFPVRYLKPEAKPEAKLGALKERQKRKIGIFEELDEGDEDYIPPEWLEDEEE